MRHLLAVLVVVIAAVSPTIGTAQSISAPGDNFAPATDDDLKALSVVLAAVPDCNPVLCPSFSCPAMASLNATMGAAALTVESLRDALTQAIATTGLLLGRFEQEYERLITDDEDVRIVQALSRAFLTAGKLTLAAASLASGVGAAEDIAGKLLEPDIVAKLTAAILAVDRLTEALSSMSGAADDVLNGAGGKTFIRDDVARIQTQKGVLSDILQGVVAHGDALKALLKATESGNQAAITAARSNALSLQGTRGSIGQLIGKALTAVAEMQLKDLADRLAQNALNEGAINEAWATAYRSWARLTYRSALLAQVLREIADARARLAACAAQCTEVVQVKVPAKGTSYGHTLRLNNPRIAQLAAAIAKLTSDLVFKPGERPKLSVTPAVIPPTSPAQLSYQLPQCAATKDARIRIIGPSQVAMPLAVAEAGGPKTQGFTGPDDPGVYELRMVGSNEVALASTPLTVEIPKVPDSIAFCGGRLTLKKGIYSADWRDRSDHLRPKKMAFVLGKPGEDTYAKGELTIAPSMYCSDDKLWFGFDGVLLNGVQYFPETFKVRVDAGDGEQVSYLHNWFKQLKVKFDTGAIETSTDRWVKLPGGDTGIAWIEIQFERGGNSKALSWYPN